MKKSTRYILSYVGALLGLGGILYLLYNYELVATIGSWIWRWFLVVWEPLARFVEIIWRPLFVFLDSFIRGLATRPVGRAIGWFFAGYILRYIAHPRVRHTYDETNAWLKKHGVRVAEHWYRLPLLVRILLIVGSAVGIAIVDVGLLLLPLGFLIEPLYRTIRNWIARESVANVSLMRRVNQEAYRQVRVLMRASPAFRTILGPMRRVRLTMIRNARRYHYEYREQGKTARDMLNDVRRRHDSAQPTKTKSGRP